MKLARMTLWFVLLLFLAVVPLSAQDDDGSTDDPPIDLSAMGDVTFEAGGIMPEGVVWNPEIDRFLVSSLRIGTIYAVRDNGHFEPFIESDKFGSTAGIRIDGQSNRLIIANGDARAYGGAAPDNLLISVAVFDLETGEEQFFADLTGLSGSPVGFPNDVTVDDKGNIYVTDGFAPVIYKVTTDGEASVFLQDDAFADDYFGLNGIDYSEDGYLLVAFAGSGAIFKVPVDAPEDFTEVDIFGSIWIDGMVIDADNNLIAVANVSGIEGQQLVFIHSQDDWASAEIVEVLPTGGAATTVTLRNGVPYFLNAYLNEPNRDEYEIISEAFNFMIYGGR